MRLADAQRIQLTTFDATGTPTVSHEWVVDLGADRVGFWTPHATPWQLRLSLTPVVSVQAADGRGRPLREQPVFEGRAELVLDGPELDAARARTKAKYGVGTKLAEAVDKAWELGGTVSPECAVIVHVVG